MFSRLLYPLFSALVCVGLVLPVPAQQLSLPDIGDPSLQYLGGGEQRRLGISVLQRLRARNLVVEDAQLNEYLASIGQRIAAYAENTGDDYRFFWLDAPSINAFAAPSGLIGVHTGLLLGTRNEDELAGVLAHEIAHVSQRHIARAYADAQRLSLPLAAAMLASIAIAAANSKAGQAAIAGTLAASQQHQINFTRGNEQEADRVGYQLLGRAGFDPNGMASFFAYLQSLAATSATEIPDFLRTHPRPSERFADIENRITGERPAPTRKSRAPLTYYLAKSRARVLTTPNTVSLIQHFADTLQKGAYDNEIAERYGYALALKRAGRYAEADGQIARLLKTDPDRLAFRIEAAELALAAGDQARAWTLFNDARALYADDYVLAFHFGRALATQGNPRKAMQILQPHLRNRPHDLPLYSLYAQAAQRAGDAAATHAALAEYHYLNGDLKQAIEQAELGLKKASTTPYQQAQLQARLRQFKEEKESE
ncbi:MAG: M48 family metalloprotease [Gammaproteobacteria bacterium]